MGTEQSKQVEKTEEIIIAQNGANDASLSHVEEKLKIFGSIASVAVVLLILFFGFFVLKCCRRGTSKLIQKHIASAIELGLAAQANQQSATQQASYA